MKPPSYWSEILYNRYVINTREPGAIEKFVSEVQEDAMDKPSLDRISQAVEIQRDVIEVMNGVLRQIAQQSDHSGTIKLALNTIDYCRTRGEELKELVR